MYNLYETGPSREERGDREIREREPRERDPPKRGNTVYVNGHGITEELLRKAFSNFGSIVNITMEGEKKLVVDKCFKFSFL